MGRSPNGSILFLLCVAFSWTILGLVANANLRGISPADEKFYSGSLIWCKDGSKSFPRERLNDDFCDCVDGTDEPGTSACPDGKFYCLNKGHSPQFIFSSRVNDGICDCCDGSDEYNGQVRCANTCWEAGKSSRDKLSKEINALKEGLSIKAKKVELAKKSRKDNELELSKLKREEKILSATVSKLNVEKEAVEEAEKQAQLEREKKDKEERESNEREASEADVKAEEEEDDDADDFVAGTKEQTQPSTTAHDSANPSHDPDQVKTAEVEPAAGSQTEDVAAASKADDEAVDLEKLSEEELGRVIASRWTGEATGLEEKTEEVEDVESIEELDVEDQEDYEQYDEDLLVQEDHAHEDDDLDKYGVDTSDSGEQTATQSVWSKITERAQALLRVVGLAKVTVDKSDGDRIRSQYREASSRLSDAQAQISDLESRLKEDFGKEGEFYLMYGECYETKQNKYTYKVCPFRQATQLEGSSTSRLGSWSGFKDGYSSMLFDHGDTCWNGPPRSLRVRLVCGSKTELLNIDEPSRCEYVGDLSTPAACSVAKLQALQAQLLEQTQELDTHEEL